MYLLFFFREGGALLPVSSVNANGKDFCDKMRNKNVSPKTSEDHSRSGTTGGEHDEDERCATMCQNMRLVHFLGGGKEGEGAASLVASKLRIPSPAKWTKHTHTAHIYMFKGSC